MVLDGKKPNIHSLEFGTLFSNHNFCGFRVAHVFRKYFDVVSARFTARSIFCEMATGAKLRVAQISHSLFCKIIIVAQIPWVVLIYEN